MQFLSKFQKLIVSTINVKNKVSASVHAKFDVIFSNVHSVTAISYFRGQKMRFFESSQNSETEKSIFGQFEVTFLNV